MDIRDMWPDEPTFTRWLANRLSLLGKVLGMDLKPVETEARVPGSDRSVDILAKYAGRKVVIENQLEATDPDHLGRLLIYAAGHDASIVIWVTPQFTDEHLAAIDWLNTWTCRKVAFYGVEVGVIKNGGSCPAPDFRLVARPNAWSKKTEQKVAGLDKLGQFFQSLIDRLQDCGLPAKRVHERYIEVPSDFPKINYCVFMTGGANAQPVEVYLEIRTGTQGDYENDKKIFDSLIRDKSNIENDLKEKPCWKETWKIQIRLQGPQFSIDDSPVDLNEIADWIIQHLLKLKEVCDPRLKEIMRQSPPEEG